MRKQSEANISYSRDYNEAVTMLLHKNVENTVADKCKQNLNHILSTADLKFLETNLLTSLYYRNLDNCTRWRIVKITEARNKLIPDCAERYDSPTQVEATFPGGEL